MNLHVPRRKPEVVSNLHGCLECLHQVLVLSYEQAPAEELMPYFALRMTPCRLLWFIGRTAGLAPTADTRDCVYSWHKDTCLSMIMLLFVFPFVLFIRQGVIFATILFWPGVLACKHPRNSEICFECDCALLTRGLARYMRACRHAFSEATVCLELHGHSSQSFVFGRCARASGNLDGSCRQGNAVTKTASRHMFVSATAKANGFQVSRPV